MLNFLISYAYLYSQKKRDKWARFTAATKPYSKHMLDSGGVLDRDEGPQYHARGLHGRPRGGARRSVLAVRVAR